MSAVAINGSGRCVPVPSRLRYSGSSWKTPHRRAYVGKPTTSDESLQKATVAAREQLAGSGRYSIVSVDGVDAAQVHDRTLRNCDGCEATIARKLGAQQSMIGIVNRATQTDYYIAVVIRDTSTGKVIDSQAANFAGGEEGWASGVRMLIKHQVLVQ